MGEMKRFVGGKLSGPPGQGEGSLASLMRGRAREKEANLARKGLGGVEGETNFKQGGGMPLKKKSEKKKRGVGRRPQRRQGASRQKRGSPCGIFNKRLLKRKEVAHRKDRTPIIGGLLS